MARESDTEEEAIREHNRHVAQLGSRLANLGERDDWPSDWLGTPTAREFRDVIEKLSGNERMALTRFVDHLNEASNLHHTSTVWLHCPMSFIKAFEKSDPTDADESDAMSPADLFERACSIVVNYVPWKSDEDELAAVESTLLMGSASQREAVIQWATDVIATNESGTDLLANDAPLLRSIPEPLRDFFDLTSLNDKSTDASLPPKAESLPDKPSRSREETKAVLEEQVYNALQRADAALDDHAAKHKAAKAAKDVLDEAQEVLIAMIRALRDFNAGGEYQQCLPFPAESDAATASPQTAAKSGTTPGNADDVAGWHVSVLTTKELLQKTNGQSEGAGITDSLSDALVDLDLGTIGILESHMKKHGEFWFKSLKGIGEGKAEKVTAALGCLRSCYPVDTEPLEPLVLDDAYYNLGKLAYVGGLSRDHLPDGVNPNGHQGRSWLEGYDDAASTKGGE